MYQSSSTGCAAIYYFKCVLNYNSLQHEVKTNKLTIAGKIGQIFIHEYTFGYSVFLFVFNPVEDESDRCGGLISLST